MRSLQQCDFCGDDAVGTFELVPPELEPTDAEQRRVLLCADCEDRLETLLEPLFDRLGVTGDATGSSTTTGEATSATGEDETPLVSSSGSDDESDPGAEGGSAFDGGRNVLQSTDDEDETIGDASTDGDAADPESGDDGSSEEVAESDGEADGSSAETDGAAVAFNDDAAPTEDRRPPSGYSRVMRLLRNREFPMGRADAESLVAGAYDFERREVEAIIEYALETGELEADGDQLVRP